MKNKRKLTFKFADKCRFLGYGGPRQALEYCHNLGLGVCQTAFQLQSTDRTIHRYANLYGLKFNDRRGYAK